MKQTLSKQITRIIFIISVIAVTGCSLVHLYISAKQFQQDVLESTIIDARLISDYAIIPLEFNNGERAFEILEKLEAKPKIETAILFDNQGIVFAFYSRRANRFSIPDFRQESYNNFSGDHIEVYEPVTHQGQYHGTLYLKASSSMKELLIKQAIVTLLIIFILSLFIFILARRFQRRITAPLLYLMKTMKSVTRYKDYTIRVERDDDDEIGSLYNSFNTMQKAILTRENELIGSQKKAEEADRLKSAFLANMSHEIRTPLNAIVGFTNLLNESNLTDEEKSYYSQIIQNRSKDLLEIIDDIISISKIEAGQLELHRQNFNIDELIDDLADDYRNRIKLDYRKRIDLVVQRQRITPSNIIHTSPQAIRQILSNLISNALKFTAKGEIILAYSLKPKQISFSVSDTGIGIEEKNQELIFERFRQIEEYQTRNYGGTGLGLSICKALVTQLDGKIRVKSAKEKGATFSFSIPLSY